MNQSLNILIVEDHDAVGLGLHSTLLQGNIPCNIIIKNNADEALKTLKSTQIDVVLLDIILKPESNSILIDGDDLLREIRNTNLKTKVIVISKIDALSMLDYIINNLEADGYILKSRTSLKEVIPAIQCVISEKKRRYFSMRIESLMNDLDLTLDIDYIDRVLLSALGSGKRQSELEGVLFHKGISITLSGIEKRIKRLRERFGAQTTIEIVALAIKEGIIQ